MSYKKEFGWLVRVQCTELIDSRSGAAISIQLLNFLLEGHNYAHLGKSTLRNIIVC